MPVLLDSPYAKEEKVRRLLRRKFGMKFSLKRLEHSMNHEFDAVSEDESIIAEVKSNGLNKKTVKGNLLRSAVRDNYSSACLLLLTTIAKKKLLVLTDKNIRDLYTKTQEAKAASKLGIEILTPDEIKSL
jgi:hypothetical protein